MIKIRQAIVVEGRYDKNTLKQLVDAPILETHGFGVMHDKALLALLRLTAKQRGLIILTDSDGAGFVIRNFLKGALPKQGVLHAYIPDIPGKERRKRQPGREGLLGVEGMTPEILYKSLQDAGATFDHTPAAPSTAQISKADFYSLGLSGKPDSSQRREKLKAALQLPGHLSSNALLEVVNILFTPAEFRALVASFAEPSDLKQNQQS